MSCKKHKWVKGEIKGSDKDWEAVFVPVMRCEVCGSVKVDELDFRKTKETGI